MRQRTLRLRYLVALVLFVMAGRLTWVQMVKADEIIARGEAWRLQRATLTPVRGALKDRAGRYLAVSVPVRDVVASPKDMEPEAEKRADRFAEVAGKLGPLLGHDPLELVRRFTEAADKQFLPLQKGIDLETAAKIQALNLPGIALVETANRTYPQRATASQLIGYLVDAKGVTGLEAFYDEQLRGKNGFIRAELTHTNAPIDGTVKSMQPPVPGLDLTLTIDAHLQQTFEAELDATLKKEDAKRALAIAIDVATGEILAMAMRPGADLSDRQSWFGPDGKLDHAKLENWALGPLPPGSIFKTITAAIALEERVVDMQTSITDEGKLLVDGWTITNWDRHIPVQPKPMTITELMQTSSNIGLIKIGQRIPRDTFAKYLRSFGFMEPTGLDLYGEGNSVGLDGFAKKRDVDWANMYIGQHLEVTPIQMVTAVAAIANGGNLLTPHLVRAMHTPDGELVWSAGTTPRRQVISRQTAREMQDLMVAAVEKGTGGEAKVAGYSVGGKTGTAQKFEKGKEKDRYLATFVGFAPAADPRVAMIVMVDEPVKPGFGGLVAAPLFSRLMPHALRTMGILPDRPVTTPGPVQPPPKPAEQAAAPALVYLPVAWAEQRLKDAGFTAKREGQGPVVLAQAPAPGSLAKLTEPLLLTLGSPPAGKAGLPDFRGLTLAEANRLAGEVGVTLKPTGSGFITSQEPAPGSLVDRGAVIPVTLTAARPNQP